MQPFTENIDKMRGKQESLAFWQRRRRFLVVHWNKFPPSELNNLSYCYSSVMVYSCRYSPEIMNRLYDLAMEVASQQEKENARLPQEIQEKWETAMTERENSGRIVLNAGEDLMGESTENEGEADDSFHGDQNRTDVDAKGPGYKNKESTPQKTVMRELENSSHKKTPNTENKSVSSKADTCTGLQRSLSENLQPHPNKSVPFPLMDHQSFKLKIKDIKSSSLKKASVQQNKSAQSLNLQDRESYYKDVSPKNMNFQKQGVTPSQQNEPKNLGVNLTPMHSNLPKKRIENTASFLNRHCKVDSLWSPQGRFWHPPLQTEVKENMSTKGNQIMEADGKYKSCNKKPNGAGDASSSIGEPGVQSKAVKQSPPIPECVSKKAQKIDSDRKDKMVTFRTQSNGTQNKKKTTEKEEGPTGVTKTKSANVRKNSSFENKRECREFYTPKRSYSTNVLNNAYSSPVFSGQYRFSSNNYDTPRQKGQPKPSAAPNPHSKTPRSGIDMKGLHPTGDGGGCTESQARKKDFRSKHEKPASKEYVEEVPRKKCHTRENSPRGPQGAIRTRVGYPSVQSQPYVGSRMEYPYIPATGKRSIPTSKGSPRYPPFFNGSQSYIPSSSGNQSYFPSSNGSYNYRHGQEIIAPQRHAEMAVKSSLPCSSKLTSSKASHGNYKSQDLQGTGTVGGYPQSQGNYKSQDTGMKQRQQVMDSVGGYPQRQETGKPNRCPLKTFLHNLLQKARN